MLSQTLALLVSTLIPADAADVEFFERRVRPLLADRCFDCHGPDDAKAGLRLDHIETILEGGARGPAIVRGAPDESRLIQAIRYDDVDLSMPPRGRLPQAEIDTLVEWVRHGAPWPDEPRPIGEAAEETFDLEARREEHWAWQPLYDVTPPADPFGGSDHPVDRFICARVAEAGLTPSERADRRTLIRRLSFDLTGLPPTPDEVKRFVDDDAEDAWDQLVDRTLASPHYAERQARHWMDLMRYAETYGHEFDYPIHDAWRYRDYLIRALEDDVPYDQLVLEHVAGDLLEDPRRGEDGTNQSIQATAHYFFNQQTHAPVDVRQDEADRIDNQIEVLTKSFLGMTVSCARCHDHKFDAISAEDYYALAGFLKSSRRQEAFLDPDGRVAAHTEKLLSGHDETLAALREHLGQGDGREDRRLERAIAAAAELRPPEASEVEHDAHALRQIELTGGNYRDQFLNDKRRWRDGRHMWWTDGDDGDRLTLEFDVPSDSRYDLTLALTKARDYGIVAVSVDGEEIGEPIDLYDPNVVPTGPLPLGAIDLAAGPHQISFQIVGHNEKAVPARMFGIDTLTVTDRAAVDRFDRDVANAARKRFLDPARLRRWIDVLHREEFAVDHPLYPVAAIARQEGSFSDRRDRVLGEILFRVAEVDGTSHAALFEDFDGAGFDGWFESGLAFGAAPTGPAEAVLHGEKPSLTPPDVAHSGRLTGQHQGALRSPTFRLESAFIHYRLSGKGQVRLIIDGYFMDVFNALLFNGMSFDVDREGWTWHRQDVRKYLGHRAHIELLDHGDGSLAVDEIRFGPDHPRFDRAALERSVALLTSPKPRSFDSLASALCRRATAARRAFSIGEGSDDVALLDWLLRSDLIVDGTDLDAVLTSQRKLAAATPRPVRALAIQDGPGEDEHILIRGSHRSEGPVARRRFLAAIDGGTPLSVGGGSGRLELARRMLADDNPLTSRVAVNRAWHHLFGRGIVRTTDNFGVLGELPTHPELLDWLAAWFRDDAGWSTKRLHRLLVTSETYRQSSARRDRAIEEKDPENLLLHRSRVRRLQGEALRDAMLLVSGDLDPKRFGPPVPIHLTEFMTGRGRPGRSGPLDGERRRSIYTAVRRNFLSPMMLAFDAPLPHTTVGNRTVSNVPAQGLILMNDPLVVELARRWSSRLLKEPDRDAKERIVELFESALARPPSDLEVDALAGFVEDGGGSAEAWTDLCHAVFNTKEFAFLP